MTGVRTRFAGLPIWGAAAILCLLVALMIGGIAGKPRAINAEAGAPYAENGKGGTDADLYRRIVTEMQAGGDYYAVAAPALRDGHFPLQPFFAFRLPTLATLLTLLPPPMPRGIIFLLIAALIALWTARLADSFARPFVRATGGILVLCGAIAAVQPAMMLFHETWAALLIALSLALRRDGRWRASVIAGLCAVLIRETAIAYVAAMALLALLGGHRREAMGWSVAIAVFAAFIAWHAAQVAMVIRTDDPVSPGWGGLGGWAFFLSAMRLTTPLTLFPPWVSAILIPLSLLGWVAWRSPFALRATITIIGYAVMLMLFARPDNFYWGLLIAPLMLLGLMFVPAALSDLVAAFRRPALDTDAAARQ